LREEIGPEQRLSPQRALPIAQAQEQNAAEPDGGKARADPERRHGRGREEDAGLIFLFDCDLTNPSSCYCGTPLSVGPAIPGVAVLACPACGYWRTILQQNGDRDFLQSGGHPSAYQGRNGHRFGSLIGTVRALCARYRAARAGLPPGSEVLDFGCGQGYFLDALRSAGHRCVGLEINEITARQALARGHTVASSLAALPDRGWGGVVSIHVLEHTPEPLAILRELRGKLTPGARYYFEVPNFASVQARLFRQRWLHCEAGLHIHHFTAASFLALLRQAGYEPQAVATYSFEHGLLGWLQSFYNLCFPYNRFFRNVILNRALRDKLRCWAELLLFPLVAPLAGLCLIGEALAQRGAVLRVTGSVPAPGASR
jgi:SAM-dependent methyltransferase